MTPQAKKATPAKAPESASTVDEPAAAVVVGVGDPPIKNDDGTLTVGPGQVMLAAPVPATREECTVKDGTPHMGAAVPGSKVCSRHTMRYHTDGSPRGA